MFSAINPQVSAVTDDKWPHQYSFRIISDTLLLQLARITARSRSNSGVARFFSWFVSFLEPSLVKIMHLIIPILYPLFRCVGEVIALDENDSVNYSFFNL